MDNTGGKMGNKKKASLIDEVAVCLVLIIVLTVLVVLLLASYCRLVDPRFTHDMLHMLLDPGYCGRKRICMV
ncbi:F11 [Felid gammaherpesvirus 1]|uniref:F11 n=1 Tax=Felid gammaherpesvirus 1 TaxID=2560468 RepID=A0A0M4LRQ5_9GAMA|nr:F11 [Felis catus gammaherpesvirus 1]ALE14717.1 F11 [Felis catus gammaherpesvirus 1]